MVVSVVNRSAGTRSRPMERGTPVRRKKARTLRQGVADRGVEAGHRPDEAPATTTFRPAVTVTIAIADGGLGQRPGVLAALRELVQAAGPNAVRVLEPDVLGARPGVPAAPDGAVEQDGAAVRIDPRSRTVLRDGRLVELSRLEYDLLLFLVSRPGSVFSRRELLAHVWGHTYTSERTVDVHVSRLRSKVGEDLNLINTVYGVGYRLAEDPPIVVS